jgi:hypothetical protein
MDLSKARLCFEMCSGHEPNFASSEISQGGFRDDVAIPPVGQINEPVDTCSNE